MKRFVFYIAIVLMMACGTDSNNEFSCNATETISGDTNIESNNIGSTTGDGDVGSGSGGSTIACDDAYLNLDSGTSNVRIQCGGDTGGTWEAVCDSGPVTGSFSCNGTIWSEPIDPCHSNSVTHTVTFILNNCTSLDLVRTVTLDS